MKKVVHRAESRGYADHGWLITRHTFSFAGYYDPERVRFGLLRVLNDDIIMGGSGFGTHPHDNMEIISIPIYGALEHRDSMGSVSVIRDNEVQVMSAGSGVTHSEYNHSKTEKANFLQLWIFPEIRNAEPGYDQKAFEDNKFEGKFGCIVSPDGTEGSLRINQQAWLSVGVFEAGRHVSYNLRKKENGLYVFVIHGSVEAGGELLNERDGMGVWETGEVNLTVKDTAKILLIEVPMR